MAGRTTFGKMLQWIESPFQTSVSRERELLVEQANKIRRLFYDAYREFELEVDLEECFCLQAFAHCSGCPEDTVGITLPAYMQNLEAAWASGQSLSLYSKWREYKTGLKPTGDDLRAAYDMAGRYCTERDPMPALEPACVQFLAKSVADSGKKVKVAYESTDGREEEYVTLRAGAYIRTEKKVVRLSGVVLPTDLKGGVTVSQQLEDSLRILSEYLPWEQVPSYKRVKIVGACDEVVLVRATRQYTDLYDDDDIVETDNRIAIENAARYLFYSESGTDAELLQKAQFHLAVMKDALRGMNSRDKGERQDGGFTHGPPARRSRLNRHRRGHQYR